VHYAEPGQEAELEAVVREFAEDASSAPGFVGSALLRPLPKEEQTSAAFTEKMQEADNSHTFETIMYWESEADRLAWRASWESGPLSPPLVSLRSF